MGFIESLCPESSEHPCAFMVMWLATLWATAAAWGRVGHTPAQAKIKPASCFPSSPLWIWDPEKCHLISQELPIQKFSFLLEWWKETGVGGGGWWTQTFSSFILTSLQMLLSRHLLPRPSLCAPRPPVGFCGLHYGDCTVHPSVLNTLECHPEVTGCISIAFCWIHHSLRHIEGAHPLFVEWNWNKHHLVLLYSSGHWGLKGPPVFLGSCSQAHSCPF